MSHLPYQTPHRVARQPGIRIEGDDVADIGRDRRAAAAGREKGRIGRAAKQLVQLVELATLALPPHPMFLAVAPDPSPMEQQEAVARRSGTVQTIQPCDALPRDVEERGVSRRVLGRCIGPVREQGEVQLEVRRGQIVDLEALDVFLDGRGSREQGGHHDHGAQMRRDAFKEREAGDDRRSHASGHGAVDQRDGRVE